MMAASSMPFPLRVGWRQTITGPGQRDIRLSLLLEILVLYRRGNRLDEHVDLGLSLAGLPLDLLDGHLEHLKVRIGAEEPLHRADCLLAGHHRLVLLGEYFALILHV